jgi:RNA polymerase sigma-70 factor (ECF subfamily)
MEGNHSDLELISLIKQNDRHAFEMLYERHWLDIYKSAFFLLKDHSASMDIVQDIFIWIWEKRAKLDIQFLPAYLKTAVRFKVANYIRAGNIREDFYIQLASLSLDEQTTVEEMLELDDLRKVIAASISALPPKCREIFLLSREAHLSNQQIADLLGISVKTVEAQKTIALKRIRSVIAPVLLTILSIPAVHQ